MFCNGGCITISTMYDVRLHLVMSHTVLLASMRAGQSYGEPDHKRARKTNYCTTREVTVTVARSASGTAACAVLPQFGRSMTDPGDSCNP